MQEMLQLFKSVHGRMPKDGNEFAKWCEFVRNNSKTIHKPLIQ